MIRVDLLPAGHGDCLWIEYGDAASPSRVLIDGGAAGTFTALHRRIEALPQDQRRFELFVVTHVDADHIEGAVRLLHDTSLGVTFGDVWFNGWDHLNAVDATLGGVQGEMLSALIGERGHPWNAAFGGGPIVVRPGQPLPTHTLPGGLELTVLSPEPEQLTKMAVVWAKEVRKAGLEPGEAQEALEKLERTKRLHGLTLGDDELSVSALARAPFKGDGAPANGSSIGLLAEHEGQRLLLTGDAHSPVLVRSLDALLHPTGADALKVDLCKLSHHGSRANTSVELLERLRCKRWAFSSNGAYFEHPDREAVARVIVHGGRDPELIFNYRTKHNELWADARLQREHEYVARYADADDGIVIEL